MDLEDLLRSATKGVLIGAGVAAVAPLILAAMSGGSKPMAKALINAYLDVSDKFKEMSAESLEQWQDLLAEVQAERAARAQSAVSEETVAT